MHVGRVGADGRPRRPDPARPDAADRAGSSGTPASSSALRAISATDPDAVLATLAPYGLELVGAFAPIRIADEDGFREDLDFVDRTVAVLAATGARGPIVLAADENEERLRVAGRPEARAATSLTGDRLKARPSASSRLRSAPAQPASPRRSIRTRRPTSKAPRRSRRSSTRLTRARARSPSTPATASSAAATRWRSCSGPATASRIST